MPVSRVAIPITLDGSGAGTSTSPRPVIGEILEVRGATPALGTATYTITRLETGGTILAGSQISPFTAYPRGLVNAGGSAVALIPCDEMVRVQVASGPASQAGTIHVYYKGF